MDVSVLVVYRKSSLRHATCLFCSSLWFVQVPNGHEEDELADGEVMNYMCRDDEVVKENLYSYYCLVLKLSFEQQQKNQNFFPKSEKNILENQVVRSFILVYSNIIFQNYCEMIVK